MASDVVPVTDRGLAYGDGVFRTVAFVDGRLRHWNSQYAKLAADCARLGLDCADPADFLDDIQAAVADRAARSAVKLIVTRGPGERGYRLPRERRATRIVIPSPWPDYPGHYADDGVEVFACNTRLATQPALAGIKHLNRLENVLARAEWSDDAYAEGLMRDEAGRLIAGTMSNVFIVKGRVLYTPALTRCGIAGVTRQLIIDGATRAGVTVRLTDITWQRALEADEMLLVNSLIGVWRVRAVGAKPMGSIGMAGKARTWLEEADAAD